MKTILIDPFPRKMDLIFSKEKLRLLKKNFNLVSVPNKNKEKFYQKNISNADFIIGQPSLPLSLLEKAKNLKAIFNVESNFMDNMDYDYCFRNNIHVLSTAPVFAQTVAEIALGFALSLKRNIHGAHLDFISGKEQYGLESNVGCGLLRNNKIGLIGYGDLAKSLRPLLLPFTDDFYVYDPWLPEKLMIENKCKPASLSKIFSTCDVIFVLASVTTKNQSMIDKSLLSKMKKNSCLLIMSRASVVNFKDLIEIANTGRVQVATDVFPEEPVKKK